MRFFHIVVANLLRKKIRTALTIATFGAAAFLFGVLAIVNGAFSAMKDVAGADRLVVVSRTLVIQPLPISLRDRIAKVPGVRELTTALVHPGYYQGDRVFIVQMAIDTDTYRTLYPEFRIPDDQWAAFLVDREGAVIGERLAERFGWSVGQRVPVRNVFGKTWEFNIRGVYTGERPEHDTSHFWYHRKFLEENGFPGGAGWYVVRVTDPSQAAAVVKAIDEASANTPWATRTSTESEFAAAMVRQLGNIESLIRTIGGVVFFTLLLVTGNIMAIAVRERVSELGILKAVGFSDVSVLILVLAESTAVAGVGAALGLALAKAFTLAGDPTRGMLPSFILPARAMTTGLLLALLTGCVAGLVPALAAMRLRVVQALRRV